MGQIDRDDKHVVYPQPSKAKTWDLRKVAIYALHSLGLWLILVVGCIVYDHYNRPEKTMWDSFVSIALPGLFFAPALRWKLGRALR